MLKLAVILRRHESGVELKLDCNLQSISASIEAVCRKTLQDGNRDSGGQNPRPKNSVKNYMSAKITGLVARSALSGGS